MPLTCPGFQSASWPRCKSEALRRLLAGEAEGDLREGVIEVPKMRVGSRQTLETLINEEALLLAKYLRGERKAWVPSIAV